MSEMVKFPALVETTVDRIKPSTELWGWWQHGVRGDDHHWRIFTNPFNILRVHPVYEAPGAVALELGGGEYLHFDQDSRLLVAD